MIRGCHHINKSIRYPHLISSFYSQPKVSHFKCALPSPYHRTLSLPQSTQSSHQTSIQSSQQQQSLEHISIQPSSHRISLDQKIGRLIDRVYSTWFKSAIPLISHAQNPTFLPLHLLNTHHLITSHTCRFYSTTPDKDKQSSQNNNSPEQKNLVTQLQQQIQLLMDQLKQLEELKNPTRFYKYFFFATVLVLILIVFLYFAFLRAKLPPFLLSIIRTVDAYTVLFIVIADYKWSLIGYADLDEDAQLRLLSEVHKRSAQRFLNLCFRNGGIYIKAGQFVSSLNQVLPPEYCQTLSPCQDAVPVRNFDEVRNVIKKELNSTKDDLSDIFEHFNDQAIAAASLAQVYEAWLKNGRKVAVKVQHPNLRETVEADGQLFEALIGITEYFFKDLKLMWLLEEFRVNIPYELDFTFEAKNNEKFNRLIASKFSNVRTPDVVWEYVTPKVLVMEFIENGVKLNDSSGLQYIGADLAYLSKLIIRLFSEQIFIEGFVHADPHPGNILVRRNPSMEKGIEMIVLDHGLYSEVDEHFRTGYAKLWLGLIFRDQSAVLDAAREFSVSEEHIELFSTMLTNRAWNTEDVGITTHVSKEEERRLLKYATDNFFNITMVLSEVDRRLLLLLKTNDLLRNLQAWLGVYLNYFSNFAIFAQKAVNIHEMREAQKRSFLSRIWIWVYCRLAIYKLRFQLRFYIWYKFLKGESFSLN